VSFNRQTFMLGVHEVVGSRRKKLSFLASTSPPLPLFCPLKVIEGQNGKRQINFQYNVMPCMRCWSVINRRGVTDVVSTCPSAVKRWTT